MILTLTCQYCGKLVPRNPRIKNQKYCCAKECQQARIRIWKNRQYKKNSKYQKRSLASQKVWRSKYPAYQYQRDYRKTHPEYVMRNGDLQRERNKKRQKDHSTMIVKTHALLLQPKEDGVYTLSRIKKNMIVNRNALSLQPSIDGSYALFKVKGRKIVNRNALMAEVHK
jgi:endogenous inhibitor of DNA gyrase (YacG/DUF329 family)